MAIKLEAGSKASYISKRYIRVVEATTLYQNEDIRLIAIAAGALYKLPRTELIHKERLDEYMKKSHTLQYTKCKLQCVALFLSSLVPLREQSSESRFSELSIYTCHMGSVRQPLLYIILNSRYD